MRDFSVPDSSGVFQESVELYSVPLYIIDSCSLAALNYSYCRTCSQQAFIICKFPLFTTAEITPHLRTYIHLCFFVCTRILYPESNEQGISKVIQCLVCIFFLQIIKGFLKFIREIAKNEYQLHNVCPSVFPSLLLELPGFQ